MKKRRSAGEIASILNEYRRSGLTQAAFAEGRGIPLSTLTGWLRKGGKRAAEASAEVSLVPVHVVEDPTTEEYPVIELELSRGGVVRFPASIAPAQLARFVSALVAQC